MKTVFVIFSMLLTVLVINPATAPATEFLSFGTGSPAGTYYFIGAGFAALANKYVKDVRITAESTAASTENCRLLCRGVLDMGLACMGTLSDLKKQGLDVNKIRLIAVGHTSDVHWIVRKDSDIKDLSDFKGKTVAVGPAGSATLNIVGKKHLKAGWGLTFDDFTPKYLSFTEASRGIRDNTIDAGLIFAGTPIAALMELSRDVPIRLIPIKTDEFKKLRSQFSNVVAYTIPAGTYHDIPATKTYVMPQMWVCRTDLSPDLVYNILKAIYDHPEQKNAIHPLARMYNIKNAFRGADGVPVGYHEGAIRYYKEKGIWDKRAEYYQ